MIAERTRARAPARVTAPRRVPVLGVRGPGAHPRERARFAEHAGSCTAPTTPGVSAGVHETLRLRQDVPGGTAPEVRAQDRRRKKDAERAAAPAAPESFSGLPRREADPPGRDERREGGVRRLGQVLVHRRQPVPAGPVARRAPGGPARMRSASLPGRPVTTTRPCSASASPMASRQPQVCTTTSPVGAAGPVSPRRRCGAAACPGSGP